jgi:hypothetical protein
MSDNYVSMWGTLNWRTPFSNPKVHVVVDVDPELAAYARTFIPPSERINVPRYPAHITAMRGEGTHKHHRRLLEKVRGMVIPFECGKMSELRHDNVYWWLPVYSPALLMLRKLLDLPEYTELTKPPDGAEMFHITVGNTKGWAP